MRERESFWSKLRNVGAAIGDAITYVWRWINFETALLLFLLWLLASFFILILQPRPCETYHQGTIEYVTLNRVYIGLDDGRVINAEWRDEDFRLATGAVLGEDIGYCERVGSIYGVSYGQMAFQTPENAPD